MTPKEAAEKWSKQKKTTVRTVNRWISEDRIPYTVEDGVVNIPDIKRPHIIKSNTRANDANVRKHILAATENREYIDAKAFMGKLEDYEFAAYMDKLVQEGKIEKMSGAPDTADNKSNQWYIYNVGRQKEKLKEAVIRDVAAKPVDIKVNLGNNIEYVMA
ncbi:MAG: hypothetical protein LUD78_13150 [Clostridiales bacterium]|nr:hypothetical protein [Clostridiales bacterium]